MMLLMASIPPKVYPDLREFILDMALRPSARRWWLCPARQPDGGGKLKKYGGKVERMEEHTEEGTGEVTQVRIWRQEWVPMTSGGVPLPEAPEDLEEIGVIKVEESVIDPTDRTQGAVQDIRVAWALPEGRLGWWIVEYEDGGRVWIKPPGVGAAQEAPPPPPPPPPPLQYDTSPGAAGDQTIGAAGYRASQAGAIPPSDTGVTAVMGGVARDMATEARLSLRDQREAIGPVFEGAKRILEGVDELREKDGERIRELHAELAEERRRHDQTRAERDSLLLEVARLKSESVWGESVKMLLGDESGRQAVLVSLQQGFGRLVNGAPPPPRSIGDRLRDLIAWVKEGVITEEEAAKRRAEILRES